MLLSRQQPLVAVVKMTGAKEEVRLRRQRLCREEVEIDALTFKVEMKLF